MASGNIGRDNDMELNFEITDQNGRDATQDSLTEEAKFLLTTHKPTRVFSTHQVETSIVFF